MKIFKKFIFSIDLYLRFFKKSAASGLPFRNSQFFNILAQLFDQIEKISNIFLKIENFLLKEKAKIKIFTLKISIFMKYFATLSNIRMPPPPNNHAAPLIAYSWLTLIPLNTISAGATEYFIINNILIIVT